MFTRKVSSGFLSAITRHLPCAATRKIATSWILSKKFNFPLIADEVPRAAGIPTMLRLPTQTTAEGLDACFLGIPLDNGTMSHRRLERGKGE